MATNFHTEPVGFSIWKPGDQQALGTSVRSVESGRDFILHQICTSLGSCSSGGMRAGVAHSSASLVRRNVSTSTCRRNMPCDAIGIATPLSKERNEFDSRTGRRGAAGDGD